MSAFAKVAALEEHLNPVLVKEVRQALRGKQFKSAFGFTIVVSLVVAISIVLNSSSNAAWEPIGPDFLTGLWACLTIAVVGFVPLAAFNAMGAEFEENTFDMLVLSHMRPRQIMLGKLLAAGVQAMLYFSVFGFFAVFAFLLGGVDLTIILVGLPLLALISLALSSVALGLSTLARKRTLRVGLMVVLASALVGSVMGLIAMQAAVSQLGLDLALPEVQAALSALVVAALALGSLFFVLGASRLAHEEENRSTGLRVLGALLILTDLAWARWLFGQVGAVEVLLVIPTLGAVLASLLGLFFVSEREVLGRRVETTLPSSRVLRLLLLPWLPGGARGMLWLAGALATIIGFVYWNLAGLPRAASVITSGSEVRLALLTAASYSIIYLGLPSALFTNRTRALRRSTLTRVLIPSFFVLGLLVPSIVGFLIDLPDLAYFQHYGNPFWVFIRVADGKSTDPSPVFVLALFVLLLQSLRIARAVRETVSAPGRG